MTKFKTKAKNNYKMTELMTQPENIKIKANKNDE